ncbi:hypothetical protein BRAS3843_1090044 [Bradyrhizobium sp. STM 3843]|nr:hypothetical protein BRAS3843_1090044 [Bradyrhizobium sp. STM 3843]
MAASLGLTGDSFDIGAYLGTIAGQRTPRTAFG